VSDQRSEATILADRPDDKAAMLERDWAVGAVREHRSRTRSFIRAFRDPSVFVPGAMLLLIVLLCFVGPWIFNLPNPNVGSFKNYLLPIGSPGHLLGTNEFGNDMLSRLLHGGQVSLLVGIGATAIGFSIGVVLGTTAGFYGGLVEALLMRIFDVLFAFPGLILALAIAAFLGPSVWHTIWAISFFSLAGFGRLARGQTIRVRNYDYVVAAKASGASAWQIVFGHIIPNVLPPLFAFAMFSVGGAMVAEAALSFLGLGIQIPEPSWGNLISGAESYMTNDPMLLVMPAVSLFLTVLAINLLADSLRHRLRLDR
jgi:peptide/nickel transport system permease protein